MTADRTKTVRFESTIDAPFDDIWAFFADPAGLETITPSVAGLTITDLKRPPGSPSDGLPAGTRMQLRIGPWPFQIQWVAQIVSRVRTDQHAQFTDRQVEGPFSAWEHTHSFVREGNRTRLIDTITYRPPHWLPTTLIGTALKLMLVDRHRRTANQFIDDR